MSWLKKNVDYVSMGTQQMSDDADLEQTEEQKKQAIKRYLADTSGLLAHEHNLSLLDYLSGNNALTGTYEAWERLYRYSKRSPEYQEAVGDWVDNVNQDTDYYPVIPVVLNGENMQQSYTKYKSGMAKVSYDMTKMLGTSLEALDSQYKNGFAGEYGNVQMIVMHLSVGFPDKIKDESTANKGEVTYIHRYLWRQVYLTKSSNALNKDSTVTSKTNWTHIVQNKKVNIRNHTYRIYAGIYSKENKPKWAKVDGMSVGSYRYDSPTLYPEYLDRSDFQETEEGEHYLYLIHRAKDNEYHIVYIEELEPMAGSYTVNAWVTPRDWASYRERDSIDKGLFLLDRNLIKDFNPKQKDELLLKALQLSWAHRKTVRQYRDWVGSFIQVGAFIAAAVTFVYSAGTGASASAAMLKAATTFAAIYAVEKAIDYAVKVGWISPSTGATLKFIANIAAIAYGAGFDFSKLMTAPNIMKMVNASFDSYSKFKQYQMNQMMKSYAEHQAFQKQRNSELSKKQQQLMELTEIPADAKLWLDAPSFKSKVDLFETPEMMYSRHYNSNVVNLSLSQVYNQSDLLLNNRINLSAKWVEPNLEVYEYVRWKNI